MSRKTICIAVFCLAAVSIGLLPVPQGRGSRSVEAYVKCEISGTLYHDLKLDKTSRPASYVLANGIFWQLNLFKAPVSESQLREFSGRQVIVEGTLPRIDVTRESQRRVFDVSSLRPIGTPGTGPIGDGPEVKPYIRGYIIVGNLENPKGMKHGDLTQIYVPGVQVFLTDPITRQLKARTRTDLSGRFDFPPQPPGEYQLCWRADGFIPGCLPDPITVEDTPIFAGEIPIPIQPRENHVTIYGKVSKQDGRGPRWFEPLANINAFAQVVAADLEENEYARAYVNNLDEYILPQVPIHSSLRLRMEIEGGSEMRTMTKDILSGGSRHRVDIMMTNRSPEIGPIVAEISGERVRRVDPGATASLSAVVTDPDEDAISYHWSVPPGAGTLTAPASESTGWIMPPSVGDYEATLVVRDGKGGYSKSKFRISTNEGVLFSGRVSQSNGPPAASAAVEVNGERTSTNASGYFRIRVKEADRFVVNIRKPGYALVSRVYLEGVLGGEWKLRRASVVTVDPTLPIRLTDPRNKDACAVPFSTRVDWSHFPEQRRPRIQDGRGGVSKLGNPSFSQPLLERLASLRRDRGCGPGIRIAIPANALVDEEGNPPTGNVDVALFTVDPLSEFDMPGDYTVREGTNGSTRTMESWGAGMVEITQGDKQYNLRDGATALITIPITDIQLLDSRPEPDTIPLLSYDESTGDWVRIGEARRNGNAYEGELRHFSAINTDLVKQDQSCVRIYSPQPTSDFPLGLPETYKLEITIPQGPGAAPRIIQTTVDNSVPYHVIYNLPSNTDIVLVPHSVDESIPYGTFIVNTGGPQVPTNPNRPEYPYSACRSEVVLYDVGLPTPPTDAFLHGLFTFAATNLDELDPADPTGAALASALDAATEDYYAVIDPRGQRETLDEFLTQNNIDGTATNARYVNAADLGFGRDMYAAKNPASDGGFDYAFAVSNYGSFDLPDLEDFQRIFDPAAQPFATVCMEYSRIENPLGDPEEFTDPERVMKFFVYDQDGARVNRAALDEFGERPIPQLCVVCHGGTIPYPGSPFVTDGDVPSFTTPEDAKMGSVFLPFDLGGLDIFDGVAPGFDKSDQQDEIQQLNQYVRESNPGQAIVEMIDKMYPAGATTQTEEYAVNDWELDAANEHFYKSVIGKSCRMCHVARPLEIGRDIRFREFSETVDSLVSGAIDFRVCNTKQMPHAHVAFKRFWGSQDPAGTSILYPYQPAQLIAWGQTFVSPDYAILCAAPEPPVSPNGVPYSEIQQILDNNCIVCHRFGGIADFLQLTDGVSHGNIVNQPSSQVPTMDLIEPNDPGNSYLLHKVQGTQTSVGGFGGQMPLGGPSLSPDEISLIVQWILQGADA